jgi:hypothetical protein
MEEKLNKVRVPTEIWLLKNRIVWDSIYVSNNVTRDRVTNARTLKVILKSNSVYNY